MAYDFSTRRLTFLKSPKLVDVVKGLERHSSALEACREAGVGDRELPIYEGSLRRLAETGMLVRRGSRGRGGSFVRGGATPPRSSGGRTAPALRLTDRFERGLDAPICLTWELTYACNLACAHCLSSSGRRDPDELSTAECKTLIDELAELQVFYVNIGGGEPTIRRDFWRLLDYATSRRVGVKFSTNGSRITPSVAERLSSNDYVDVQLSLDGATAEVNDRLRGPGSFKTALRAMRYLADAGVTGFKLSVVVTRENVGQLDRFKALASEHDAQLRLTRLRPSGRGADVWASLHPTPEQQRFLYEWLRAQESEVLTGDSFFHLGAYGDPLPGLNLCGAGRVVCLIDPLGDVYACPFTIHDDFRAGSVRARGGLTDVWRTSPLFARLRAPSNNGVCHACSSYGTCRGGCMASKYFTGLPLDGPDPECVKGHGEAALSRVDPGAVPRPSIDHSSWRPVPVALSRSSDRRLTASRPAVASGR